MRKHGEDSNDTNPDHYAPLRLLEPDTNANISINLIYTATMHEYCSTHGHIMNQGVFTFQIRFGQVMD